MTGSQHTVGTADDMPPRLKDSPVAKTMELIHTFDMPGKWYAELFGIASDQYGYVTPHDATSIGAQDRVLVDMERHGHLHRVSRGLYRFRSFPPSPRNELMAATLWPNRLGVISHDSALDLWDLCDVNPAKIHVTVPKTARVRRQVPPAYAVHIRSLGDSDITNVDGIPVVTPLQAILDGIERHLDDRLIRQAIDGAQQRGLLVDNDLSRIAEVGT
jgi:predicted transcriptional regulator of viral defense system